MQTVEAAFDQFASSLRSSRVEIKSAADHRQSIETKLRQTFGLTAFFRTGSFGNGTNVSGFSDVDYFAVLPRESLKQDSSLTLRQLADALRERFPTTTNIRVNGPAVQVPFGLDGAEHTEVIPVDATGATKLGFRQFDMPDGYGGWMFSAPESHNAYVDGIDQKLGGKARQLVPLIKAWRSLRDAPIRSFYLEMYVARFAAGEGSIIFDFDIRTLLRRLTSEALPPILDPRFPDDGRYLDPCSSALKHADALGKVARSADWADEAIGFRLSSQVPKAFERWDLVFNYTFPACTAW